MSWKIVFYDEKVEANIKKWPAGILAKFIWVAKVIEKVGPTELGCHISRRLAKGCSKSESRQRMEVDELCFAWLKEKL